MKDLFGRCELYIGEPKTIYKRKKSIIRCKRLREKGLLSVYIFTAHGRIARVRGAQLHRRY